MRWLIIVGLIILQIIYLVVGGLVFWALESRSFDAVDQEISNAPNASTLIKNFIVNISLDNLNESDIVNLIQDVISARKQEEVIENAIKNWNFVGSLFFAMTVVTTIGDKLNGAAGRLEQRISQRRPKLGKAIRSVLILVLGFAFFVLVPSAIFMAIQDWTYGISVYYSLITLSTIGFGDYVAEAPNKKGFDCIGSYCAIYRILTAVWIYVGLAWLAGLISSMQETFLAVVSHVDEDPLIDKIKRKSVVQETQMTSSVKEKVKGDEDLNNISTESDAEPPQEGPANRTPTITLFSESRTPERYPSYEYKDLKNQDIAVVSTELSHASSASVRVENDIVDSNKTELECLHL